MRSKETTNFSRWLDYSCSKKIIVRDTIVVLPVLIFTIAWIILIFVCEIDFSFGADHGTFALCNFIIPLFIIGVGQLLYQIISAVDMIKAIQASAGITILCCLCIWLAVAYLYYLVYILKIIFFVRKNKNITE